MQKKNKKVNKKRRSLKIVKVVSLIAIVAAAIAFALISPVFNISYIDVFGNEKISSNVCIKQSGLKKDINIFKFRKSDIISNIKKNSYVEDVNIKRILPNKIEITIKERKAKFLIEQNNNKYIYIDENGNILEKSEDKKELITLVGISTENKNLIEGSKLKETDIDKIRDIIKIENTIKNNNLKSFDTIDITNKFDYILIFEKDAKKVYIGDTSDLDTKMLYMKYIMEEQEGVPGSIYLNQSKKYFSPE